MVICGASSYHGFQVNMFDARQYNRLSMDDEMLDHGHELACNIVCILSCKINQRTYARQTKPATGANADDGL
jgi:hypothetical protein